MDSQLPACYCFKRTEPSSGTYSGDVEAVSSNEKQFQSIWSVTKAIFNSVKFQTGRAEFPSISSDPVLSIVGYMVSMLHPITKYNTLQECLGISQKETAALGQQYAFITMDLAQQRLHMTSLGNRLNNFHTLLFTWVLSMSSVYTWELWEKS